MRLLFLNPAAAMGGAERSLLDLLAGLRQERPEWRLRLLALADGPLLAAAAELGVETESLPMPARLAALGDSGAGGLAGLLRLAGRAALAAPATMGYLRRLRRAVRAAAPDLLHSNGIKTHLLTPWLAPRRCPTLWHVRDFVGRRPAAGRLLRAAAGRKPQLIAITQAVAEDLATVLPGRVTAVLRDAIDTEGFADVGPVAPLDELAGLPPASPGTLRVGLVATYARWKGHEVFLQAAALAAQARPPQPLRFYIVGGPIYQTAGSQTSAAELTALAERLGLAGQVGLAPFQSDAAPIFRALDVAVHASTAPEPLGRTILEGMCCGRAVVAAAAGGAVELFVEGEQALGHVPGDAGSLAAAIGRLLDDSGLRQRLGAAGRARALGEFCRPRLAKQFAALAERLVGAPGSPRDSP